ncbi:MAG: AraC family transcriptional regulator [Candidatus Limivivens sp.]|nr:AraC family transcriptional regulator [Candidatus Limivivens sp.]
MIYENQMKDVQYPLKCAVMRGNLPFMNHCHQELEIIQLRRGSLKVYYEEEEYILEKGDIWIVPPFASHRIGKGTEQCERLAILLDLKLMGTWAKGKEEWLWLQDELNKVDMYSGHWKEETRSKITGIIEKLYLEYLEKAYAWQLAMKSLISELVLAAAREMPRRERSLQGQQVFKMKNILEYIALHYYSDITLQSCAEAVGFNSAYLSRYFSSHMGITFQEYVKRLRIDKAKWLLMTERVPITEVCYQSGFRDVKTFNKLFKQECGMSPTEFKKSVRE